MPPATLWQAPVLASRLRAYEVWTRIPARGPTTSPGDAARRRLGRLAWIELTPVVLARALEPWPAPVRTLDARHLASLALLARSNCLCRWRL